MPQKSPTKKALSRVVDGLRRRDSPPEPKEIAQLWLAISRFDSEALGSDRGFFGSERFPSTEQELANLIGVARETISRWKKQPGFELGRQEVFRKLLSAEFEYAARDNLQTLTALARAGDPRSQKLWWDLFREMRPGIFLEHDPETRELREENEGRDINRRLEQLLGQVPKKAGAKPIDADYTIVEDPEVQSGLPDSGGDPDPGEPDIPGGETVSGDPEPEPTGGSKPADSA